MSCPQLALLVCHVLCCIESLTLQIQFQEFYLNGIEGWELWGRGRGKAEREFVFYGEMCECCESARGDNRVTMLYLASSAQRLVHLAAWTRFWIVAPWKWAPSITTPAGQVECRDTECILWICCIVFRSTEIKINDHLIRGKDGEIWGWAASAVFLTYATHGLTTPLSTLTAIWMRNLNMKIETILNWTQ